MLFIEKTANFNVQKTFKNSVKALGNLVRHSNGTGHNFMVKLNIMKTQIKILIAAALLSALSCKKADRAPVPEPESETATYTESADADTVADATTIDETAYQGSATTPLQSGHRKYPKRKAEPKKLTQYQIDSIKTERGAIVTPVENVGASLTPGSGMAVPSNKKVGAGTTATMGSSTGN